MTRDEVLARLRQARKGFDARVAAIPRDRLDAAPAGRVHTPKQIVAHVNAYEELITQRLRLARASTTTVFDRDRTGWEAFNTRIWEEAAAREADEVVAGSSRVFDELVREVAKLADEDLNEETPLSRSIDPAWLGGRTLAELIGTDAFEHYPMHFAELEAAAS